MAAKGPVQRFQDFIAPGRRSHRRGDETEEDVTAPSHQARTRATGGVDRPGADDQGTTTGTTANETFVGRVAGEDIGYAGETGAERARAHTEDAESGNSNHASEERADGQETTGDR